MSSVRKRIVFDTSSLIPACLYPEREPAQIFRRALLEHDVFASTETFNELATVLTRNKFNAWRPLEQRLMWVRLFRDAVAIVEPENVITECRDPKDNKFLEVAVAVEAEILISSDVHLLEMDPFRGIQIMQLAAFNEKILHPR
jgi:uncharacterized protein